MAGFDRKQARMVESVPTRPIAAEFHSLDERGDGGRYI